MKPQVTVVDYGVGNLYSVTRAFEQSGAEVHLTGDPRAIREADRLVLPGVGAFRSCVEELDRYRLTDTIKQFAGNGRPMLGICVGMQMLFDQSEEFGVTPGLGLISGDVKAVPSAGVTGIPHKIPHIGWNQLRLPSGGGDWRGSILEGLTPNEAAVYFVHSYTAHPSTESARLADADYDGCVVSAVVRSGPIYGCQFHPEKSGEVGLVIIRNFLKMSY